MQELRQPRVQGALVVCVTCGIRHSSERPCALHPRYFNALHVKDVKIANALFCLVSLICGTCHLRTCSSFFISKCWVIIGQLQIVSRRREKMLLLIQLPTLGNEEAVCALFYLRSEYEICQNKNAEKWTLRRMLSIIQTNAVARKKNCDRCYSDRSHCWKGKHWNGCKS